MLRLVLLHGKRTQFYTQAIEDLFISVANENSKI